MWRNIRIAEDLESIVSLYKASSNDATHNTANATEAVDTDVGGHIELAKEFLASKSHQL